MVMKFPYLNLAVRIVNNSDISDANEIGTIGTKIASKNAINIKEISDVNTIKAIPQGTITITENNNSSKYIVNIFEAMISLLLIGRTANIS